MQDNSLTPMLRQYYEIKKQYPGTILFFRLGDFYELFNEDAVTGSRELEITLTARHKDSKNPIPMCGVPHHAAATYISKLVKKGYRVAVCEQTEDASQTKKLVKREVVKIITPGTAVDPQLLEPRDKVYLASLSNDGDVFGASFLELSTGDFLTTQISGINAWQKIVEDVKSFSPREIIFPEKLKSRVESEFQNLETLSDPQSSNVVRLFNNNHSEKFVTALTVLENRLFDFRDCEEILKNQFGTKELTGFGLTDKNEAICSAGAVLKYARETQKGSAEHISDITFYEANDFLVLDSITLKNLKIVENRGENSGKSLFNVIDFTVCGMGTRLLRSWLLRPSIKRSEISTRQTAVNELCDNILREKLRFLLKEVADLERLVGRLSLGGATSRDLLALNRSLLQTPKINKSLSDAESLLLQVLSENISELPEICDLISRAIADEPPVNLADGGTIRDGFSSELDEIREIENSAKQIIAGFEEDEKKRSGIANLRIKFNGVFGYFIEVSKGNASKVPENYERRQTLTNVERFTTPQLKEWEAKVLGAEEKIRELESEIFRFVSKEVCKELKRLQSTARALATLDALQSLAETAVRRDYTLPVLHDGDEISVKKGRHAIVEVFNDSPFIPNDLEMNNSTDRLLIITGPNMGGKSTVLTQIALIQILAQMGSFVPAAEAKLPVVDRIWTRIGASDDLASGRSTFMVEMTETAAILHNATPKSLILMDEIGRGTSTFDGLSIAWAVAEFLHNSPKNSAKTLFATHYHELTELAYKLPGAKNYQITASEKNGEVVFLHKLEKGKASKSYGIAVAKLAGLPPQVIERAKEVLAKLEKFEPEIFRDFSENRDSDFPSGGILKKKILSQVSLFAVSNENVIDKIRDLQIENISPESALKMLKDFKDEVI